MKDKEATEITSWRTAKKQAAFVKMAFATWKEITDGDMPPYYTELFEGKSPAELAMFDEGFKAALDRLYDDLLDHVSELHRENKHNELTLSVQIGRAVYEDIGYKLPSHLRLIKELMNYYEGFLSAHGKL